MRRRLLIALAAAAFAASGCEAREDVLVLRLGHILDSAHPVHQGMAHMGEWLEEL